MSHISRVEVFFFKPLSIAYLCASAFYMFTKAWIVAGWMICSWLIIGAVGASLHPKLTLAQLAQGTLDSTELGSGGLELSADDSFKISKSFFATSAICAISGIVIGRHYDFGWWAALGVGAAGYAATWGILALLIMFGR